MRAFRAALSGALALGAVAGTPAFAAGRVDGAVRRLLAKSPAGKSAFVGMVVDDDRGHRLFSLNADHAFTPASNAKLFSTALALERLGPDKRFETRVEQRGRDLFLIGTGDANLSGRVLPYQPHAERRPALTAIDELAQQVAAKGIRVVEGDVVGDDTAFAYEPLARGWSAEDIFNGDGTATGALMVNDNTVRVEISAGAVIGAPAAVTFDPPVLPFAVSTHVLTGTTTWIHATHEVYTAAWEIEGTVRAEDSPFAEHLAAGDPALFAALAFKYSLEQHGIEVRGSARALHRAAGAASGAATNAPAGTVEAAGREVARHESLPLMEDLRLTNKISQNAHAELLLFDVAGSRTEGLKDLDAFLADTGAKPGSYRFYDGSGLSRLNLVTPQVVVRLLEFMSRSKYAAEYFATLPVSGIDGSLEDRMGSRRLKGRVHAKSGTMSHTSALSGYIETRRGRRRTFAIFINNALADSGEQRELIDKLCALFVD